jgi:hypothetical protein
MQSNRTESKSCFYCGRPGHIVKDCHKKKSDEARNKPRTHSGHYGEKSSNNDLRLFIASDDIDEPPNFDSRDLRLFVSNTALSAETDDIDAWFVDFGASIHMTCNKNCMLILKKHRMVPTYILEMTALIRSRDTETFL